jgi:hypothetical protein
MNRKSEVSLSLSLLGRALWISGDAYLEEGVSLTWMCLHGEAPLMLWLSQPVRKGRLKRNAKANGVDCLGYEVRQKMMTLRRSLHTPKVVSIILV